MIVKDRVARGDNKYLMKQLNDGTGRIELTPSPDEVIEEGTVLNKSILQPLFDGLDKIATVETVVNQGKEEIQSATNEAVERLSNAQPESNPKIYTMTELSDPQEGKIYNVKIEENTSTINEKPVYKENTSESVTLKAGKVATVYYKQEVFYAVVNADVVDSLESNSRDSALSANQGRLLKEKVDQAFQSASEGKTKIAQALTGKGIEVSSDDTFSELAGKIGEIKSAVGDAKAEHVLMGKTFSSDNGSGLQGTIDGDSLKRAIDKILYPTSSFIKNLDSINAHTKKILDSDNIIIKIPYNQILSFSNDNAQFDIYEPKQRGIGEIRPQYSYTHSNIKVALYWGCRYDDPDTVDSSYVDGIAVSSIVLDGDYIEGIGFLPATDNYGYIGKHAPKVISESVFLTYRKYFGRPYSSSKYAQLPSYMKSEYYYENLAVLDGYVDKSKKYNGGYKLSKGEKYRVLIKLMASNRTPYPFTSLMSEYAYIIPRR